MRNTEKQNPNSIGISEASTEEMLKLINDEDALVPAIVRGCIPEVSVLVEKGAEALSSGHKIFYCGAGTSGRLSVADAAECPPTYGLDIGRFTAVIAGGKEAVFNAQEGCEDSRELGEKAFLDNGVSKGDLVIGISASGQAPYVIAFMELAKKEGCYVGAIVNNPDSPMSRVADTTVFADTGAEVIKGSTRMKAGTSQKLILNMFSTAVCIKIGCTFKNYMVNMKVTNSKLEKRAVNMVCEILGIGAEEAQAALEQNNWSVKETVLALSK